MPLTTGERIRFLVLQSTLMWASLVASLGATQLAAVLAACAGAGVALVALGVAIHAVERRGTSAGRDPSLSQAPHAGRRARHEYLSAKELSRLSSFRPRARLMAGEPLGGAGWWQEVRMAWSEGYAGWVIACLLGSFSMATHFGAYWMISGGGWLGAIAITLLSTGLMVTACAWVGLGLISGR